jgi:hypothetical protein
METGELMHFKLKHMLAAVVLATLTACGPTDFAEDATMLERTLTVREIDRDARSVAVTGDGQRFNITVSDAVVNFDQVQVGDRLNVRYRESVAVSMALPGETDETLAVGAAVTPPQGARPGVAAGQAVSSVFTFVSYDPCSNTATLRRSDGALLIAEVPRNLRRFAAARQPGDRVVVDLTEAFAVSIEPAA